MDNVFKIFEIILWFLTTLYVLTQIKSATKYIILWKVVITSFKISICFICSSFTKKNSQGTKYGDQNVHFFDVTAYKNVYNFYTPCIFTFILAQMTSME